MPIDLKITIMKSVDEVTIIFKNILKNHGFKNLRFLNSFKKSLRGYHMMGKIDLKMINPRFLFYL